MASGPYFDERRGTYSVQWFNGVRWTRATVHHVRPWKKGMPRPKKVPPEAQAAVKVYADKEKAARLRAPGDPERTIKGFLAAYQEVYRRERAAGSARQLDQSARHFLAFCATAKAARLSEVTPLLCQRFLDARASKTSEVTGRPVGPTRLNLDRAILSGAWRRARKLGEVESNPWTATEAPGWERERKRKVRRASWSPEQVDQILAHSRPWVRDLVTLGTQTGLRIAALCGLEWRDVEWSKDDRAFGTIRIRPELDKAGRGYAVPMSRAAHDTLSAMLARKPAGQSGVLASARGGAVFASAASRGIVAACKAAGMEVPKAPNHTMRRTFGRWAVLGHLTGRPVPLYVVSRWMGHATVKMTEHYLDIETGESHDWMAEYQPARDQDEGKDSGGQ